MVTKDQIKQSDINFVMRGEVKKDSDYPEDRLSLSDYIGGDSYSFEVVADYIKSFLFNSENHLVEISCQRIKNIGTDKSSQEKDMVDKLYQSAFNAGKDYITMKLWGYKEGIEQHLSEDEKAFFDKLLKITNNAEAINIDESKKESNKNNPEEIIKWAKNEIAEYQKLIDILEKG